jgi:hypothetical protein
VFALSNGLGGHAEPILSCRFAYDHQVS